MLARFWNSKSGNFAMMLGVSLPVILAGAGMAIDYATMSKAKAVIQSATDAAVLAASRINDDSVSRKAVFDDFLAANLLNEPTLANVVGTIEIEEGRTSIRSVGRVTADVKLHFPFIFGTGHKVSAEASAYESTANLEIALALDNTGSMGAYRMGELRKAATALLDILESVHKPNGSPKRVVKAALVPFVTAVNVKGTGFKRSWIDGIDAVDYETDTTTLSPLHGSDFDKRPDGRPYNHFALFKRLGIEWKGCVQARPGALALSDEPPSKARPETLFVPYFAPDEPGIARAPGDKGDQWNNSYLNDMTGGPEAVVDVRKETADELRARQKSVLKYATTTPKYIRNDHATVTAGPNYACPTPIVPLTDDFNRLRLEVSKLIDWKGSGTNVSEGLAWAQRVLSPGEPYTEGAPFGAENTSKYVVVFTDGENQVFGASGEKINKSDYGAYGFFDTGRVAATRGAALTTVNGWTLDVCTALKEKKVEIFTILLGADTLANRTLYKACATTPENYFPASDVSELDAVFKKIGSRIAKLHFTG